jgi:hypothetical protein
MITTAEGICDWIDENKRDDKSRNILKREGYRETKHERTIEFDKGDIETT